MMGWRSTALLICAIGCAMEVLSEETVSPPTIPTTYQVSGTIELPYAEIVEPYTAWVDGEHSRSRIDSYNGLASVFYLGNVGKHGVMQEVVYETTETALNRRICLMMNGSADAPVGIQVVVPDLTKFTFDGEESCGESSCYVWQQVETIGDKVNRYRFSAIRLGSSAAPYSFHFLGYDNLFGSHYDEYRVTYTDFRTVSSFPESDFQSPISCSDITESVERGLKPRHRGTFEHLRHFQEVDHIEKEFSNFQKKHSKLYKSEQEHFERGKTFRANHHFVESMNKRNLTYKLRLNHMADLSFAERRNMLGLRRTSQSSKGGELFVPQRAVSEIPTAFDWRLAGAVTPVKDQAICGSCWSFSTTGVIEGALFLKTQKLVTLSQQNLMDCSWGEGNYACDGGEQSQAYEWIIKHGGIATAHSYGPYLMQDGKCHFKNASIGATITGYVRIKEYNENDLLVALASHPVAVNIDASHQSFGFYGHGVYFEPKCGKKPDQLDHSVLAVGYGTFGGEDYWLVKNSWSVHWGNDGYVLMSRKDNNCGVASDASFVKMD